MIIGAQAAKGKIEPFESVLIDPLKSAVALWFDMVSNATKYAHPLKPTTRACFIHDHSCPEIDAGVADFSNVFPNQALGFFALRVDSDILMRLKYIGQGAPSNVATAQQKLLAQQQYDEAMLAALGADPALAPPTFLTCGYTLGDGKLGRVEIRCECKGKQMWSFDIYGGDAASIPLEFPGTADQALPAVVKSNRKTAAEKGQELAEEA
jgi:hypothetical protein